MQRVKGDTGLGRLTRRREFLAAAKGARHHGRLVTLQAIVRAAAGPEGLRAGFTVTRKAGHATERNRIRRRLRAALRDAASGHRGWAADLVVLGRREVLSASFGEIGAELGRAIDVIARKTRRDAAPAPLAPGAETADLSRRGAGTLPPRPTPRR